MMKKLAKLTKAALLATATAFLLAGFPACSSDDNDPIPIPPPKEVSAELDAKVGELTAGTPKTVNATVTVDGDTFSTTAKNIEPGEEIPENSFALEADDVEVSAATLEEWVDDSTARISFTVTANADSEGGKIHALIKVGTLATCTEVVKTNSVIYTVEGKDPLEGLTKTVRFFNDADATTAIHTVEVVTGNKPTEAQIEAAKDKLTAPEGKVFDRWDDYTTAAITENTDFHAIWKNAGQTTPPVETAPEPTDPPTASFFVETSTENVGAGGTVADTDLYTITTEAALENTALSSNDPTADTSNGETEFARRLRASGSAATEVKKNIHNGQKRTSSSKCMPCLRTTVLKATTPVPFTTPRTTAQSASLR